MQRRRLLALAGALLASGAAPSALAQAAPALPPFSPEQLDQMLAPVALYPDALLAQVLMAATYPLEVAQAARWASENAGLRGVDAVAGVQTRPWDVSVKSLVSFPAVLGQMNAHLDWTQKLGDALLGQPQDVALSIQRLRSAAFAAGSLKSGAQLDVTALSTGDDVQYAIAPADPAVVYVPMFSPLWAYGRWRTPAFPPFYWPPPVAWGYGAVPANGFAWGAGLAVGSALFGGWTWRRGETVLRVDVDRAAAIDRHVEASHYPDNVWRHDPAHRGGVAYRQPEVGQLYRPPPAGADRRDAWRGLSDDEVRQGGSGSQTTDALNGVARGPQVLRESRRGQAQQVRVASHMPPRPQRPPPRPMPQPAPRPAPPPSVRGTPR